MTEASPQRANMGFIGAIVAVATIGGFLFGYDSGAVNGTQEGLRSAFGLSDAGLGFTVGSLLIGCFIGAFFAGMLADKMGRRNVMRLAALLFLVGALVQGFAHLQPLFVLARICSSCTRRAVRSRLTLPNPTRSPASSYTGVITTFAQKRVPSLRTRHPSSS